MSETRGRAADYRGASWKQKQIHSLKYTYGRLVERWEPENHMDDRGVFCRTYQMMLQGLRSLAGTPDLYIRVAVGERLRQDRAMLDRIVRAFEGEARRGRIG